MQPTDKEPNWKIVLAHEAGHAVAALALFDEAAPICLRGETDGRAFRASYRMSDREDGFCPNPRNPLHRVIVYAAGAKAESFILPGHESAGFATDERKIQGVISRLRNDADAQYLHGLGLPPERLVDALSKVPDAKLKLAKVESEIKENYPHTVELLRNNQKALNAIAEAALKALESLPCIDGQVLLEADQIRTLWELYRDQGGVEAIPISSSCC